MTTLTDQSLRFGEVHFAGAKLGNVSRSRRLVALANRMVMHPSGTLPEKLPEPADLRAFYRLVNQDRVTHAAVLAPHYAQTRARMCASTGPVLLLQDSTELDYTGLTSLADQLGQIGNGSHRGYIAHHVLAVTADTREVLGLAQQMLHRRCRVRRGESRPARRSKPDRESRLWSQACAAVGPAPAGRLWVHVSDRGSDLFEYLAAQQAQGGHYVVRAQHNRWVLDADGQRQKLRTLVRAWPHQESRKVEVPARDQRPARTALVTVAYGSLTLPPPRDARGEYERRPLTVWAVHVQEVTPPAAGEPLEWLLLTNVPVHTVRDAWERVEWYEVRWVVEEFHKGQKTGCGIEELQFTTTAALAPAIGVLSVLAVFLLQLRSASRDPRTQDHPATAYLPQVYVEVMSVRRHREVRRHWTVKEFYYALARLGGHQNRKSDGPPGWIVLWRGWTKLEALVEGAEIAAYTKHGQT